MPKVIVNGLAGPRFETDTSRTFAEVAQQMQEKTGLPIWSLAFFWKDGKPVLNLNEEIEGDVPVEVSLIVRQPGSELLRQLPGLGTGYVVNITRNGEKMSVIMLTEVDTPASEDNLEELLSKYIGFGGFYRQGKKQGLFEVLVRTENVKKGYRAQLALEGLLHYDGLNEWLKSTDAASCDTEILTEFFQTHEVKKGDTELRIALDNGFSINIIGADMGSHLLSSKKDEIMPAILGVGAGLHSQYAASVSKNSLTIFEFKSNECRHRILPFVIAKVLPQIEKVFNDDMILDTE